MHQVKQKALQTLAEAKYGFRRARCYCDDRHCDRNFPSEESVAWAHGVVDGLNSTEHEHVSDGEIAHYLASYFSALKETP